MKKIPLVLILFFSLMSSCGINSTVVDESAIKGEILIDFVADFDAKKIEPEFAKYALKKEKITSPSLNIVLFKFNPEKIAIDKLIKKVKKHESVQEAQSNKKTTKRG